jgi:predicted Zn-dependent peptidase
MTSSRPAPRASTRRLHATGGGAITRTVLPGGLRVVTEAMPGVRSTSIGVWVPVGSRDETPALAGTSHFLEHLLFKGTASRTALDIASAMDAVGGEFNAFTEKEHTCFYATVLDRDVALAVDIISDVVLNATVSARDIAVERSVVLEEIAMRDDDPADLVHDEFASTLFGDTPLGRPILGSVESIGALTRRQIAGYYQRRYTPDAMVVSVAGNVEHGEVVRLVRRAFADRLDPAATPIAPRAPHPGVAVTAPSVSVVPDDTEQANIVLGTHGVSRHDPRRRAVGRPGRRHELATVPAHPRGAGTRILGLFIHQRVCRRGAVRRLRGLPARQGRRGARPHGRGARRGSAREADCR